MGTGALQQLLSIMQTSLQFSPVVSDTLIPVLLWQLPLQVPALHSLTGTRCVETHAPGGVGVGVAIGAGVGEATPPGKVQQMSC